MRLALFAVLVLTLVPAGSESGEERFACNMKALTKDERTTHEKSSRRLFEAVQEQRELPNGYAFRLPPALLTTTAQWVSLERKCCPFFAFEIELERHDGPLWLRITGSEGIKAFIRAELDLEGTAG